MFELFLAICILSLLQLVISLALDNKFVSESKLLFFRGNPNQSVEAFDGASIVANLDMRSFCIIMIFPLIFDVEFRFCIVNIQRNFEYYKKLSYQIFQRITFRQNSIMKTKPSSATSKTSNGPQKIITGKKPTIVKCFICNQMFYSQQTFDVHMDQHQKKVNKNLPQQIQRKTLESFGLKRRQSISKKNTTLEAINQNQLTDKNNLSKTMKVPMIYGQKLQNPVIKNQKQAKIMIKKRPQTKATILKTTDKSIQKQDNLIKKQLNQDKQIQQIDEAIRQSSLLMNQITFLTERISDYEQINLENETISDEQQEEENIVKQMNQSDFIKLVRENNLSIGKIEENFIKTQITHNKGLENCQIQIQYLKKIKNYSQDIKYLQRINKIKGKVLQEVINLIMANQQSQLGNKNKNNLKNQNISTQQQQAQQIQNSQARICASCLDSIGFGEICTKVNSNFYHKECFLEGSM